MSLAELEGLDELAWRVCGGYIFQWVVLGSTVQHNA
jgi:hypothetical protein